MDKSDLVAWAETLSAASPRLPGDEIVRRVNALAKFIRKADAERFHEVYSALKTDDAIAALIREFDGDWQDILRHATERAERAELELKTGVAALTESLLNVTNERDALRGLLREWREIMGPLWTLSAEGRAMLARVDAAIGARP